MESGRGSPNKHRPKSGHRPKSAQSPHGSYRDATEKSPKDKYNGSWRRDHTSGDYSSPVEAKKDSGYTRSYNSTAGSYRDATEKSPKDKYNGSWRRDHNTSGDYSSPVEAKKDSGYSRSYNSTAEGGVQCLICDKTFEAERNLKIHHGKSHKGLDYVVCTNVHEKDCSEQMGARIKRYEKEADKKEATGRPSTSPSKKEGKDKLPRRPLTTEHERKRDSETRPPSSLEKAVKQDGKPAMEESTERLKEMQFDFRLSKKEITPASSAVNDLTESFLKKLNEMSSLKWLSFNSGSYYDRTKNGHPDEFDVMVYPEVQVSVDFTDLSTPGFYKVKMISTRVPDLEKTLNPQHFIVPGLFKMYAFKLFEDALHELRKWRRITKKETSNSSPSYAIYFDAIPGRKPIDIDLVPCLNINGWPEIAKPLDPDWISLNKVVNDAMWTYDVVCKTYPGDAKNKNLLWRLSFTRAEKMLVRHANSADTSNFKKNAFRTIKWCIQGVKDKHPGKIKKFSSHNIKHFMFSQYDTWPKTEKNEVIIQRNIIENLIQALSDDLPFIANYFIPAENVIKKIPKEEISLIIKGLQDELRKLHS